MRSCRPLPVASCSGVMPTGFRDGAIQDKAVCKGIPGFPAGDLLIFFDGSFQICDGGILPVQANVTFVQNRIFSCVLCLFHTLLLKIGRIFVSTDVVKMFRSIFEMCFLIIIKKNSFVKSFFKFF